MTWLPCFCKYTVGEIKGGYIKGEGGVVYQQTISRLKNSAIDADLLR